MKVKKLKKVLNDIHEYTSLANPKVYVRIDGRDIELKGEHLSAAWEPCGLAILIDASPKEQEVM